MHMSSQFLPWLIVVTSIIISTLIIQNVLQIEQYFPQGCRMSYMYPEYLLQKNFDISWTPLASRYSLWLYREGDGWDTSRSTKGQPILFLPGNAGSFKQVRSIASSAATQYFSDRNGKVAEEFADRRLEPLDFFMINFNEDFSALHGPTIKAQRRYAVDAIDFILSTYPNGTRVVLLGHSMGGVVAASVLPHPGVASVITLSTPYALAPARYSADMEAFYQALHTSLIESPVRTPIVSVCGGTTDIMVPSETCRLPSSFGTHNRKTVFTTGLEGCWSNVGHQVSVWCHQVRWRIARALLDASRKVTDEDIMESFTYWLNDGPRVVIPSPPPDEAAINWNVVQMDNATQVIRPEHDQTGFLFPRSDRSKDLVIFISGGHIAGHGPARLPKTEIFPLSCYKEFENVKCDNNLVAETSMIPLPPQSDPFPVPHAGVLESQGILVLRVRVATQGEYVGLAMRHASADSSSWILGGYATETMVESTASLWKLILGSTLVTLPRNRLLVEIDFPRLLNYPLLVYRLTTNLGGACRGALFPSVVLQRSPEENHFYVPQSKASYLHTHNGGPFLPFPSHETSVMLTVFSFGACGSQEITLTLDIMATMSQLGLRYYPAIISWTIGISGWLLLKAWIVWNMSSSLPDSSLGKFPSHWDSCRSFANLDFFLLAPITLISSILPGPPSFLLGNQGIGALSLVAPIILLISTGLLCASSFILAGMVQVLRHILPIKTMLRPENRSPRKSLLHVGIIAALNIMVLPYQVIFVGCFVAHFYTCIASSSRMKSMSNQDSHHQRMHILLTLFWLLPSVMPSLAVWVRSIQTTGAISLFDSDHSLWPIIPTICIVELANARFDPFLRKPKHTIQKLATYISLTLLVVVSFAIGPRYPYRVYQVASFSVVILATHCF